MSGQNSESEKLAHEIERLKQKLAECENKVSEQFSQAAEDKTVSGILNAVPHALVGLIDRKIVFANKSLKNVFNLEPEQAIGQSTRIFYRSDEDFKKIAELLYPILEGRECFAQEFPCRTADGRDIICNVSAARLGKVLKNQTIVVMYEDITARKQEQSLLSERNEFLVSLIESLTHPFYVINANDYSIALANSHAYSFGAEGAKTCHALTHQKDTPCSGAEHDCPMEQVKQTKKPASVEHIHFDRQGKKHFMEVNCYPILDEQGNVKQVIEYSLDISDRKNAEFELKQSVSEWHRTFDAINDLIFILDINNIIIRVNKAFADFMNLPAEEIQGRKCHEVLHNKAHIFPGCPMVETKKDQQIHSAEINDPNIGIPLMVTTSPIFDQAGQMIGAVHIAKNISKEKQAEKELKRKLHDLEIFRKSSVGREMKMLEMKKKIQDLEKQI